MLRSALIILFFLLLSGPAGAITEATPSSSPELELSTHHTLSTSAPLYRRARLSKESFWVNAGFRYWLFNLYQNMYSMLPPSMQTGHLAPVLRLGFGRCFLGGQYSKALAWVESAEPDMADKGNGLVTRMEAMAGIDLHRDLYLAVGYYSFDTDLTTEMGLSPKMAFSGLFASIMHKVPLDLSTTHALEYNLDIFPAAKQVKGVAIVGYRTLHLPEVVKYGTSMRTSLAYVHAFDNALDLSLGLNLEMFTAETDVTVFYGPRMALNYKI